MELAWVPLDEARFVVVDLETTGGRPAPGSIIEIGAYRVEGGRLTASFQSIVRPMMPIPRFVEGLICSFVMAGKPVMLAIEHTSAEQEALDRYLASEGTDADRARLLEGPPWNESFNQRRNTTNSGSPQRFATATK